MAGKTIDIEEIFRKRFKGKAPRLLVKIVKNLLHQDFLNAYLKEGYEGVEFCENAVKYLDVKIEVEGLENLPDSPDARLTFVSNHPLGGVDGVALAGIIGRRYGGRIKLMVNDFLMHLGGLAPLCVPVNAKIRRKGAGIGIQNRDLPRLTDEIFASDNQILMFPAGLCSRKIDGKIQDLVWSKVFVTKSVEYHRDIVPVHFVGENSGRFYRVANLSSFFRLKFNVAMAFLPDELYRARGKTFRVIFGKPIPWQSFDRSRNPKEWAQEVRAAVYNLKTQDSIKQEEIWKR